MDVHPAFPMKINNNNSQSQHCTSRMELYATMGDPRVLGPFKGGSCTNTARRERVIQKVFLRCHILPTGTWGSQS